MRTHFFACIILAGAVAALGAQTATKQLSPLPTPPNKGIPTLTLRGCLQGIDPDANLFTLVDTKGETTYRLSGADVRPHLGHRVQIVGGFVPSANVAAQAGALDPARAAVAAISPGTGTLGVERGFRVTSVRPLAGACAPR